MSGDHRVIYGKGAQTLYTAPMLAGVPFRVTSATYGIVDLRKPITDTSAERIVTAAGTAATLDAVSTTLSAAAGPATADPRLVTLASIAGIVEGHRYLIEGVATHRRELVTVANIDTTNVRVTLRYPLTMAFASADLFRGLEVSAPFPAVEANDEEELHDQGGPYAIDWTFVGGPEPVREIIWIDRTRAPLYARIDDVLMIDPSLAQVNGPVYSVETALSQARRDFERKLRVNNRDASRVDFGDIGRDAVAYRAAAIARRWSAGSQQSEEHAAMAAEYDKQFTEIVNSVLVGRQPHRTVEQTVSQDQAEAGGTRSVRHIFRKT